MEAAYGDSDALGGLGHPEESDDRVRHHIPALSSPHDAPHHVSEAPRGGPSMSGIPEPPEGVSYDLDAALELRAALEDARDALADSDHLAVLAQVEHQIAHWVVHSVSVVCPEAKVAIEILRASQAARRLDLSTKDVLRLIHDRQIRYVMVEGIAHVPEDAIEEYEARAL